jgi:hypothetical protein
MGDQPEPPALQETPSAEVLYGGAQQNFAHRPGCLSSTTASEMCGNTGNLSLEITHTLAKNLSILAKADSAGLVLGERVPIVLTSRADSVRSRMASCAAAALYAHARRGKAALPAA